MITLLDRYIFRELFSPFLTSLLVLCFIVFTKEMLRLVELLVSKGVGLIGLFKIIVHLMPSFLVLTLPIACLIASISAFSRLSYDNELIAMRAAGISLWRFAVPVFIFSTMAFLLTLFLSQWGQPWSNVSLKKVALSLIEEQLSLALEAGVFNEPIPGMMIYVPDPREKAHRKGVFISDQRDARKPFIITAQSYQVLNDPDQRQLGIRLHDGSIHQIPEDPTQYHRVGFTTYDMWMDIPTPAALSNTARVRYEDVIEKLNETNWTDTGSLRRLVEHYKDWGFPVASLLLGLLGLPVGIVSKRSGRVGGFAIGVIIIIGFYLCNVFAEFLVTTLVIHPFAGAWLPNAIVLVFGIILYLQANRR